MFADWLQENGDPRGEFIALQLARSEAVYRRVVAARRRVSCRRSKSKGERADAVVARLCHEFERTWTVRVTFESRGSHHYGGDDTKTTPAIRRELASIGERLVRLFV